jgi:hypothetical protein
MNREGRLALRVAEAYGEACTVSYRAGSHYLDIMPEASTLVGLGHQYTHAHSLGFDRDHHLKGYQAVFGGYFSDTLLKAGQVKLFKGLALLPFMPQVRRPLYSPVAARFGQLSPWLRYADEVRQRQA